MITLKMCPTDSKRHTTRVFNPMFLDINLNGLNTLKSLSIFKALKLICDSDRSITLITTMKKSSMFQFSLKYEFLSCANPKAIDFIKASTANKHVNIVSR